MAILKTTMEVQFTVPQHRQTAVVSGVGGSWGGALALSNIHHDTIIANTNFTGNSAIHGAAVYTEACFPFNDHPSPYIQFQNCMFSDNYGIGDTKYGQAQVG
eukprot:20948-Heterococcus_DN1.PRE.1